MSRAQVIDNHGGIVIDASLNYRRLIQRVEVIRLQNQIVFFFCNKSTQQLKHLVRDIFGNFLLLTISCMAFAADRCRARKVEGTKADHDCL